MFFEVPIMFFSVALPQQLFFSTFIKQNFGWDFFTQWKFPFPSTLAISNLQNSQQFLSKFIFKGTVHLKIKIKILPIFIIPIPPYNENAAFFEL